MSEQKKGRLIYFGDPMCSWCWGIANHLEQLVEAHKESVDFELVMGGLRPGGGDAWDQKMKDFLREHWEHVEAASGQPFTFDLLEWDEFHYDTEPPCRAVVVIRSIAPEKEFPFFKAVQRHFYADNANPNELSFYQPLCEALEINFETFTRLFESEEYMQKVKQDFIKSQQYGIRGFPSIALMTPEQGYLLANGYATFEQLNERVNEVLSKQTA